MATVGHRNRSAQHGRRPRPPQASLSLCRAALTALMELPALPCDPLAQGRVPGLAREESVSSGSLGWGSPGTVPPVLDLFPPFAVLSLPQPITFFRAGQPAWHVASAQ